MRNSLTTRAVWFSSIAIAIAACGCIAAPAVPPVDTGTGGSSTPSTGGNTGGGTGGSSSSSTGGASVTATGGTTGTGGTSGTATGGTSGTATGGRPGTGGSSTGGSTGTGGQARSGGASGTGGVQGSGGAVGTGGASDLLTFAKAVDGLRLDDLCGTTPAGDTTCRHVTTVSNDALPYDAMKAASMAGVPGTTYQVKFHIRGVVEPTHVQGGTNGTGATVSFNTAGSAFPLGTNENNYQQWRITVSNPLQHYYVNAFQTAALVHQARIIDYQVTIPIAGGAAVTLDVHDGNGHLISNNGNPANLLPTGITTTVTTGQFVQLNVDGVM
jgi:hypothetical protein